MKRLALLASVAVSLMLLAGLAQAKTAKTYPTSSTLEVKKTTIGGKITSSKAACRSGRKVHGAWIAPGQHLITEPATSDSSGRWTIEFEIVPGSKGRLSVSVAPKSLGGGVTCKGFETAQVVAK